MEETWKWLIATGVAMLAVIGGVIVRDRQMMGAIEQGDDVLHERINRTRDEYVRRDDLDGHIRRLEKVVEETRMEMREQRRTNERLDATLTSLSDMMRQMMQMLAQNPRT